MLNKCLMIKRSLVTQIKIMFNVEGLKVYVRVKMANMYFIANLNQISYLIDLLIEIYHIFYQDNLFFVISKVINI